ncbi:MAG: hypothetical protein V4696_06705 [Pseudomonadota bacterium]
MFLANTSSIVRVVTGSAVSTIGVHADWVDNATGTYTPGTTNTAITTATTTTVVAAPAGSTVRNVKGLKIDNNHATSSCVVTIQHFDGTTSVDIVKIALAAGESFAMAEDGEWRHLTAYGAEYEYSAPGGGNLGIAGTVAETIPRELCQEANVSPLISGTVYLQGLYLKAGQVCTNISFFSSTTAAGTPTNQIFGLYGPNRQLYAQTTNDTTAAWAANTIKTLALSAPVTIPISGVYFVAILVTATTVPNLKGMASSNILVTHERALRFNSNSGLTTTLPVPALIGTVGSSIIWAAIT